MNYNIADAQKLYDHLIGRVAEYGYYAQQCEYKGEPITARRFYAKANDIARELFQAWEFFIINYGYDLNKKALIEVIALFD